MNLSDHLDKLKAFKVIAESRTMGEAAQRLSITQPSLTKLVQTLEGASGVQLLARGRNGTSLTEAGRQLLDYATQTLRGLEDLEIKLQNPKESLTGHLRVGAYASLAEYLWPEFIPEFRKSAPGLRLSIFTSESLSHSRALQEGEIDVLIDSEPRIDARVISWNLYEDRFAFYMSPKVARDLAPETLGGLPLISSPSAFDQDNRKISQHLDMAGYDFRERLEFDSFTAVLAMARKGVGLAVLPVRLAESSVKAKRLEQVALKGFSAKGFGPHHFSATVLENRKDDPRTKFLIHELRSWCRR